MVCIKHSWLSTINYNSDWEHFYLTRFSFCTKCHKVKEIQLSDLKIDYSKAIKCATGTWWKGLRYSDKRVLSNEEAHKYLKARKYIKKKIK